jgi:hypothetical protein
MTATLETREAKQIPGRFAPRKDTGIWARVCATAGAATWAAIAVLARIGTARIGAIELMFLFAPLVIVPLGMELGRVISAPSLPEKIAQRVQPFAAAFAVIALLLPPGRTAALSACGWLLICFLIAAAGLLDLILAFRSAPDRVERSPLVIFAYGVARIDLAVGGAWFVASRFGMRPMGIQEPIGLLTAVHFHFAGFATAIIAAATLRFADARHERWLGSLVPVVVGMPYVVAIGFVVSPPLKMAAAILFSISVAGLAVILHSCARQARARDARVLLQAAAVAVLAGMVLSGVYAILDFRGSDALTIPQMARTHGILNAVGFCMASLLGWIIEAATRANVAAGDAPQS